MPYNVVLVLYQKEKSCSKSMYLMVEFPRFHADEIDYSVVYFEEVHCLVTNGNKQIL